MNSRKRYSLWRAFCITRQTNNHPLIAEVFQNACANNWHIRFCYQWYSWLPRRIQALAVFLYGCACTAKVRVPPLLPDAIFSNPAFVNEQIVVASFAEDFAQFPVQTATYSTKFLAYPSSWWRLRGGLRHARKLFRLCHLLTKRYDFLPAMRGGSTLFYGLFFQGTLRRQQPAAALIVSNYSPQAMGLAFASHASNTPLLFRNHALPASAKGIHFKPLCSDLAILTGEYAKDTYARQAYLSGEVSYCGLSPQGPGDQVPSMTPTANHPLHLGVFLTGVYDLDLLQACLERLITALQPEVIHLRPHPLDLTRPDFSDLARCYPILDIDAKTPLAEHCQRTDFVLCGNTSAMLEVLRTGTPVVYEHRLDTVYYDYLGAVRNNLVLSYATFSKQLAEHDIATILNGFYSAADWPARMRYYDAGFQQDTQAVLATAATAIQKCLQQPTKGVSNRAAQS